MPVAESADIESFAARLRGERERHHIELRSIAENTKISLSLLQALERGDASRWPSGIFRRSFVRAYAEAIGVDPDATAQEFLRLFPDPNDPDHALPAATQPQPASSAGLRVKVAPGRAFVRGLILRSARVRVAAIACDAAIAAAIAFGWYLAVGQFWMPLAVALVGYYAAGILILGNTPGVCLFAPASVSCSLFEEDRWTGPGSHDDGFSTLSAPQPWQRR